MVQRTHYQSVFTTLASTAAIAVLAASCSNGGNVSNASPRIAAVPAQSASGGSAFTLDLTSYVTDREAAPLSYTVNSGGGTFTGGSYTNTFDAMGEFTVTFTVSDGSKSSTGSFVVKVTSSNFVVVREDNNGLFLLDSATNKQVRVASAAGVPTLAAGLADGRLVYQLNSNQLWVFDPMTRTSTRIGGDTGTAIYRAKTSDSRIVYTTGSSPDMRLFSYNPTSGYSREIDDGGLSSIDVLVNGSDLVFYETADGGQSDVFYYDAEEDDSFAIGTAATDEQLLVMLPNGGVVFSRIGGSGEADLFYFRVGTGAVEIGSDVAALATRNKIFNASGSNSEVVFTTSNGGNREIFAWNPGTGQTATVVAGTDNVYDGIGDGNEVVFHTVVSGTEHDVMCYDIDTQVTVTVRDNTDIGSVLAVTTGTPAYAIVQGSSLLTSVSAVSLIATPVTLTQAGGPFASPVGQLSNGDVVVQRADGIAINYFDVSGGVWGTPIGGTGLAFEGDGIDGGDFVYTTTVSGQVDLAMWDSSAALSLSVSSVAGTDDYQAVSADNAILFTRIVGTNTTADLFSWDGTPEVRLTTTDSAGLNHDHTVLGKYAGSR